MEATYKNNYFNPGGLYKEGVAADLIISDCRKSVAKLIGTTTDHVIFTRGGTESCNLAIVGVLAGFTTPQPRGASAAPLIKGSKTPSLPHYIISPIEHSAVLETAKNLVKENKIELSIISVNDQGIVDMDELKKALRPETVLVSVMYVNNEIGTIQPIKEIAKLIRWHKKQCSKPSLLERAPREAGGCVFHVDAIQAANYLDINVERLGVDLMSLSGSKIYGPKSSGILYVRNRDLVSPVLYGGSQEFGLRAGTEDIAQIAGFTKALEIAREMSEKESARLLELQNYFFAELEKSVTNYRINGSREFRVPNNINISIAGISSERLVIELDAKGICASSQSACRSDSDEESYVIAAIRKPHPNSSASETLGTSSWQEEESAPATEGSIRFTMGRSTTKGDISRVVKELAKIVNEIRTFEYMLTY
jgi:cysteine desulfurase